VEETGVPVENHQQTLSPLRVCKNKAHVHLSHYLTFTSNYTKGHLFVIRLHDKRHDVNFDIIDSSHIDKTTPATPMCGIYNSQLLLRCDQDSIDCQCFVYLDILIINIYSS
jgi:hypothetical protein